MYPSDLLLKTYKVSEYQKIITAVKQGNIELLQEAIEQFKGFWIKRGLLLVLDELQIVCYRNLCKKVWILLGKKSKI